MRRFSVRVLCGRLVAAAVVVGGASASRVAAQDGAGAAGRGPQFLVAAPRMSQAPVPVDVASVPMLRRRLSLNLVNVSRQEALDVVSHASGLRLIYASGVTLREGRVRLKAEEITVAAALTEVLFDAGVDVLLTSTGNAVLVKRTAVRSLAVGAIVGRITDAKTGDHVSGAEVWLDGTKRRTATGENGYYKLPDVETGPYTLSVRRVGYTKQSVAVTVVADREVTADVALRPVVTQLDELVTTVTGDQRRLELGHVVGVINADSLTRAAPVSSLSDLLMARVPGVQVAQAQGTVGGDVQLQIRGRNSVLLGTQPIVVVDGVRYTSKAAARIGAGTMSFGPGSEENTTPLNDINPNDIASIEIVKGPSAATLYGTDAANGVIVVTTKRGEPGPARWNAYGKGTSMGIPRNNFPDIYWGWNSQYPAYSCQLQSVVFGQCTQDSVTVVRNPLNDPEFTIFGSRPTWEYGVNAAGGRQDLQYYFSGDAQDAVGPLSIPAVIADRLKATQGLGSLTKNQRYPNTLSKAALRSTVRASLAEDAQLMVTTGYNRRATRTLSLTHNAYGLSNAASPTEPYAGGVDPAVVFPSTSEERVDRFLTSANGQWRPFVWLSTRATAGLDHTSQLRNGLIRRGQAQLLAPSGEVQEDRIRQLAATADVGLTATARWKRFTARTSAGAQYVRNLIDAGYNLGLNLPPGGESVFQASTKITSRSYSEDVTLGSYLEETIGINERLFLTGALRSDGSSTFGHDYSAATYPKISASWLVSEEPFARNIPLVDEFRLRYAYGASGQQPTPSMSLPTYFAQSLLAEGVVGSVMTLAAIGNPLLRPERVREHEFGFDATGWDRRIQMEVTWYRRRTVDQIANMALPQGLGSMYTNFGLTTQHGFEAQITAHLLDTPRLSWDLSFQHALHRTKLVDLGGAPATYTVSGGYVEGYPLGARFLTELVGFADANGDGLIAPSEVQMSSAARYVGESTAPVSQTLTAILGLFDRRLRVSALLERRSGFSQTNGMASNRSAVDPTVPLAEQAKMAARGQTAPGQYSTGYMPIERGDFTRLREVSAAFDLPATLARPAGLRWATIALSARNLALWTRYSGPDPESGYIPTPGYAFGNQAIPQARSWMLRVDLGF